jgi:DNA-directed RNA polymerase subunit K/omega
MTGNKQIIQIKVRSKKIESKLHLFLLFITNLETIICYYIISRQQKMSDIENDYSASESDNDSVAEPRTKLRKKSKTSIGKEQVVLSDDEADNSDAASDSDESISIADSKDDSDIDDMNPAEMDEDELFADMAKPNADKDEDEFQFGFDSDKEDQSDLEEDEDDDIQYLQKLDESVKEQTIANHHPELIIHNYDEVEALSVVVRDERGVVIDPLHRTLPFISKYERTRILGERAKQINDGAKPFVEVDPSMIDGYLIALKEFDEKKLPFILRRPLCNGASEYWKLKDLEYIQ